MQQSKIELSTKTKEILSFLCQWTSESHIYNLQCFHDMDMSPNPKDLEKIEFLESYWDTDLSLYFKDTFTEFGADGSGDYAAFWEYKNLDTEPPIIRLNAHGELPVYLAASLNDAICSMIHNIKFNKYDDESIDEIYEQAWEWYEDELDDDINFEEVKLLIHKDRKEFKQRALEIINFISEEEIRLNLKKHPYFLDKYYQYEMKNFELFSFPKAIKNISEFEIFLNLLTKELQGGYMEFTKEGVISGLKGIYPDYCKSNIFTQWVIVLDRLETI